MFAEAASGSCEGKEDAAAKDSPRQPSPGGRLERRGTLLSATTDEGDDGEEAEGPWGIHTDKHGHLLSDTSNELLGSMTTTAHLSRPTQLPTTLPIPTAAKAHESDGRRASSADATEESVARAAGSATNPYPTAFTNNASFTATGPAIPDALRAYVEGLAAHQQQQAPPPAALLGNASFIQLSSNLPAITGAFQRTMEATAGMGSAAGATTAVPPDMSATGAAVPPTGRSMSSGGAAAAANQLGSSVFGSGEASSPLGGRAGNSSARGGGSGNGNGPSSLEDTGLRSSGLNNNNFADLLRSFAGTQSFNPALMRLLQGEDGTAGEAAEEDVGDEYVLTNSDIHSLEAFLFGLRALIGQVEELERSLLEVVHGTEMAKKL